MTSVRSRLGGLVRAKLDTLLDPRLELATATSAGTKAGLRQLFLAYRSAVHEGRPLPPLREAGLRVFSEVDEDGILLYLLAVVGVGRGRFVDIGAGDGVTASNCANLALNLGFHGLFVDGNPDGIEAATRFYASHPDTKAYPPKSAHAFVTRENVNDVIRGAGFDGEIDVLSIDIDGNDYWIWEAITCVQPQIVVIETHVEYLLDDVCAPYRADFDWRRHARSDQVFGASPAAMRRLGEQLGYRLVGGNRFGFNAFFLRGDLDAEVVPTVGVEDLLRHDRNREFDAGPDPPRP
jgi:hypothetical protein